METSKAFSLNAFDFKKVGINGLLVGLAATLTYVGTHVIEVIPIVTILLDAAVKWANSNHVQDLPPVPADPVDPA
jgi:hypothetical protein